MKKAGTKVLLDTDPARVLFLSWPNYNTDFAYKALKRFQGDTVIFLGEDAGGCTGDEKFHQLLGNSHWLGRATNHHPPQRGSSTRITT